jgi:WD40 repeat protein
VPAAGAAASTQAWQPLPEGLNPIYAVAVTDDAQLAACNRANQVFVYDLPRRRLLTRLTDPALLAGAGAGRPGVAHRDLVQSLAFSPDGKLLATGGFREVKLWQRPDPAVRLALPGVAAGRVTSLATSPDGKLLAAGGDEGVIRLYALPDGKPGAELKGHVGDVTSLQFSDDGAHLFSASADKTVRTWRLADAAAVGRLDAPHGVAALLVLRGNAELLTAGGDATIRRWAAPQPPHVVAPGELPGPVTAIATTPDRKRVAVAGADHAVRLIDPASGQVGPPLPAHAAPMRALSFDATGKHLLAASEDGRVVVTAVDDAGRPAVAEISDPGGRLTAAALRPDGKQVATATGEGRVSLWRLDAPAPRVLGQPGEALSAVGAVSPDGKLLATAGTVDGKPAVLVRSAASGELTSKLLGAEGAVAAVAFSPTVPGSSAPLRTGAPASGRSPTARRPRSSPATRRPSRSRRSTATTRASSPAPPTASSTSGRPPPRPRPAATPLRRPAPSRLTRRRSSAWRCWRTTNSPPSAPASRR